MSHTVSAVNDDNFQAEVLDADIPVIVDFWAEWCGPCKMLGPIFEEVSKEFSGKVKFYKMNVDHNDKTPAKYGIRGIPTLIVFKEGEASSRFVGSLSKTELTEFINKSM